jgi:hypothetical protein
MRLSLKRRAAAIAAAIACTSTAYAQPATIVYRLGTDTLAIEQFTRSGNRVAGEMVQRNGAAIVRIHYDMTVGAGGRPVTATIARMQADGSAIPGSMKEARFRITPDSVIRESVFADSISRRAFAATNAFVNFPVFVYGPLEFLAAMKRGGAHIDSMPAVGLTGGMGFTGLTASGSDALRLNGAPYAMLLRFDAKGALQGTDGTYTTNKAVGTRKNGTVDVPSVARAMKPTGVLSVRDEARASFGPGGMVLIDYGRPLVRERTVWGGTLVPFDSVWRAGANDATHLFITRAITLGSMTLAPGMYTLWVQHTRGGTFLIVNRQVGQWGTQYDASKDVGRVPMQLTPTIAPVEEFTITVRALPANRGVIELAWGPSVASVPFTVSATPP